MLQLNAAANLHANCDLFPIPAHSSLNNDRICSCPVNVHNCADQITETKPVRGTLWNVPSSCTCNTLLQSQLAISQSTATSSIYYSFENRSTHRSTQETIALSYNITCKQDFVLRYQNRTIPAQHAA